jgi:endonuclease V-like protein UPF0215 family
VPARFYSIKPEIRILGFDDGPFRRGDESTLVVGAVFRGGRWLDGVVSTRVRVDGEDSTDRLIGLVKGLRFKDVRVMMLDGIAFGGFNIVDLPRLNRETGLPAISVVRAMPDFEGIKAALRHLPGFERRWRLIEAAGQPRFAATRGGKGVFIQPVGISYEDAASIVKLSATRSLLPEPIRAAHLMAQGVVSGQSKGRA